MSNDVSNISPIAHTIRSAVRASGLSRSRIYEYIRNKKLPIAKSGSHTLILDTDLRMLLESLRLSTISTGGSNEASAK